MDIQITLEADALIRKLDAIVARAGQLRETMPAELTAWQEQDMGRARPSTSVPDPATATTTVRPRGRERPAVPRRRQPSPLRFLRPRRAPSFRRQAMKVVGLRPPRRLPSLRRLTMKLLGVRRPRLIGRQAVRLLGSRRPILRPLLFGQLRQRMTELLARTIRPS